MTEGAVAIIASAVAGVYPVSRSRTFRGSKLRDTFRVALNSLIEEPRGAQLTRNIDARLPQGPGLPV